MNIADLYDKYNLMPQLREHQLRVGGIVKLLSNDRDSILTALVHDMGNMAKFSNLDEHWSKEQQLFWSKYGRDAHEATFAILKDAGLDLYSKYLIEEGRAYDRSDLDIEFFESLSNPALLTLYGDLRVSITGVTSMAERIADLEKRYGGVRPESRWAESFEKYVADKFKYPVGAITETCVAPLFDELLTYTI